MMYCLNYVPDQSEGGDLELCFHLAGVNESPPCPGAFAVPPVSHTFSGCVSPVRITNKVPFLCASGLLLHLLLLRPHSLKRPLLATFLNFSSSNEHKVPSWVQ